MGIECGPCNDGICDWMPCTLKWLGCTCGCIPPNTTDQGNEMVKKDTLEKEVTLEDISFEYEGDTYVVPPAKKWPLECVEAQEEGRLAGCIRELLGEKEYKRLRVKCKTVEDLDNFTNALFDAVDLDAGK